MFNDFEHLTSEEPVPDKKIRFLERRAKICEEILAFSIIGCIILFLATLGNDITHKKYPWFIVIIIIVALLLIASLIIKFLTDAKLESLKNKVK